MREELMNTFSFTTMMSTRNLQSVAGWQTKDIMCHTAMICRLATIKSLKVKVAAFYQGDAP